jgi:hypothetical protein
VLGLRPRGSLYEFVLYNLYEKMYELVQKPHRVQICTTRFVYQLYEFVCMNLYKN